MEDLINLISKVGMVGNPPRWIRDFVFKARYPDLTSRLISETSFCPEGASLHLRFLLLSKGMKELPKCKGCGKDLLTFQNLFCSKKCSTRDPEVLLKKRLNTKEKTEEEKLRIQSKIKETNQRKYGVDYPLQSERIQEKRLETTQKKYGGGSPMCDPEILKKSRETWNNKSSEELVRIQKLREEKVFNTTGYKWAFNTPARTSSLLKIAWTEECRNKRKATVIERYGVDHPAKSVACRKKLTLPKLPKEIVEKIDSKDFWLEEYVNKKLPIYKIAKNLGVNDTNLLRYFRKFDLELRKGISISNEEVDFRNFLYELLPEDEIQLGIKFLHVAPSSLIRAQHLDIYLPKYKIAFEYNGVWFHQEGYKRDKNYHLTKTLECEKVGIRLIHVWSDDWVIKQDILKSKIRSILNLETDKIYARKCGIKEVCNEDKREFFSKTHIKGDGGSSKCYGLYYEKELVACIAFKKMNDLDWDLNRYSTSKTVVGGFSRLLEHFKREVQWENIYTFADRSWSVGNVYLKNGFDLVGTTEPEFYGVANVRVNRLHYTHSKLSKLPNYDPNKSQLENMRANNIPILWGCGQLKFRLTRRK